MATFYDKIKTLSEKKGSWSKKEQEREIKRRIKLYSKVEPELWRNSSQTGISSSFSWCMRNNHETDACWFVFKF